MGRRIMATKSAAAANEAASAMKAASRPNTAAKAPPIAAPRASIAPQVEPNSAAAFSSSSGVSGEVRDRGLGGRQDESAERGDRRLRHEGQPEAAGPDGQQPERSDHLDGETVTMILRRSKRSAAAPATATRNPGSVWDTKTRDTRRLEPLRSLTRPSRAT